MPRMGAESANPQEPIAVRAQLADFADVARAGQPGTAPAASGDGVYAALATMPCGSMTNFLAAPWSKAR